MKKIIYTILLSTLASATCSEFSQAHAQSSREKIYQACPAAASWEKTHPDHTGTAGTFKATDPVLNKKLIDMATRDDAARTAWEKDGYRTGEKQPTGIMARVLKTDEENLKELKNITQEGYLLPQPQRIGSDGVDSLWLLIQHADHDPKFQERALEQLKSWLPQGLISAHDFALLVDRVAVANKQNQPYGSQFYLDGAIFRPRPFDSLELVNQRRSDIKLMPLADYACGVEVITGKKVSLEPGKF